MFSYSSCTGNLRMTGKCTPGAVSSRKTCNANVKRDEAHYANSIATRSAQVKQRGLAFSREVVQRTKAPAPLVTNLLDMSTWAVLFDTAPAYWPESLNIHYKSTEYLLFIHCI